MRIAKADVAQLDVTLNIRFVDRCRIGVRHFPGLIQQFEYPVEPGQSVLQLRRTLGEFRNRSQHHQQINEKHHQVAQREHLVEHAPSAVNQQNRTGERNQR